VTTGYSDDFIMMLPRPSKLQLLEVQPIDTPSWTVVSHTAAAPEDTKATEQPVEDISDEAYYKRHASFERSERDQHLQFESSVFLQNRRLSSLTHACSSNSEGSGKVHAPLATGNSRSRRTFSC
jgi:hypothetical protein